jgi:hypothetical protein
MNEARVQVVEPEIVTLEDVSSKLVTAEVGISPASSAQARPLGRALLVSIGIALLLASIAFWPSGSQPLAARPTLKPPIVFDVLNATPLPQTGANPEAPAPPGEK